MPHPDSTLLTITHTHRDGTLLHGTARHDGSADPLKAANWRWSRHLNSWYVPRSRDRHADQSLIVHTQAALTAAGFEVHTTIDNTPRPFAEVNQDQLDRWSARADNLAATARELTTKAAQLAHQSDQLRSIWPTGQPLISPAAIRYHQRMEGRLGQSHHRRKRRRASSTSRRNRRRGSAFPFQSAAGVGSDRSAYRRAEAGGAPLSGPGCLTEGAARSLAASAG